MKCCYQRVQCTITKAVVDVVVFFLFCYVLFVLFVIISSLETHRTRPKKCQYLLCHISEVKMKCCYQRVQCTMTKAVVGVVFFFPLFLALVYRRTKQDKNNVNVCIVY